MQNYRLHNATAILRITIPNDAPVILRSHNDRRTSRNDQKTLRSDRRTLRSARQGLKRLHRRQRYLFGLVFGEDIRSAAEEYERKARPERSEGGAQIGNRIADKHFISDRNNKLGFIYQKHSEHIAINGEMDIHAGKGEAVDAFGIMLVGWTRVVGQDLQ